MNKIAPKLIIELFCQPAKAVQISVHNWQSILLILRQEKLLARFHSRLHNAGVFEHLAEPVQRHLNNAWILAQQQQRQVIFEVDQLGQLAGQTKIPMTLLKGAGYTLAKNAPSVGRVYSDIDILVDQSQIDDMERALAIIGWLSQPMDDYDQAYYRRWAHEIPPLYHGQRGTVLDVHHNLVPPVSGKKLDARALVEYCRIEHNGVGVLNPAGQFFHSAIHLFFNEDFSGAFRDMTDLYLLLEESEEQITDELPTLVSKFGFAREVALALFFLKDLFEVTMPASLAQLTSTNLKVGSLTRAMLRVALLPKHPLCEVSLANMADKYVEIRGHMLKMPPRILMYHLAMKAYRGIVESILGKHFFTRDDSASNP